MIDANAKLGSVTSHVVGGLNADEQNTSGDFLHACALGLNIRMLNTFAGGQPTWCGSQGHLSRIDYIGLSADSKTTCSWTAAVREIDIASGTREDHFVVAADLTLMPGDQKKNEHPRDASCALEGDKAVRQKRGRERISVRRLAHPVLSFKFDILYFFVLLPLH